MTKTPQQIIDDFFFEHLGVEPEPEPNERQSLFKLEEQQLKENIDFHSKKYQIEKQ